MYYFVYCLLYIFSLLPFSILYLISDIVYFIIYYIIGYRKQIVLHNLGIAFPEKSAVEKKKIAKQFYKNLTDTFIETIKMLSISDRSFSKMTTINLEEAIALAKKGKSIQFHSGHQFNWEIANWIIAKTMPITFIGVYMKISNKAFDKIFFDLRSKKGTVLVSTYEFKNRMHQLLNKQYSIGLAADQNPGNPENAYWLNFFNKPAPFVTGPDKAAIKNNTAVVFVKLEKIKRGKYKFGTEIITENAAEMQVGELTNLYRDFLEKTIREHPDNYLWSHRRWRWDYQPHFSKNWIDKKKPIV